MDNRNHQTPESDPEKQRAVFREEDLDEILEKLKSGAIGIEPDAASSDSGDNSETTEKKRSEEHTSELQSQR